MTVADLGEFALIARISELLPSSGAAMVGIGDDAAVLAAPGGSTVLSTDLLVEGRHFRTDWSGPADIGAKAAAENLADIAAMGAVPTALLLGLALPPGTAVDWVLAMAAGLQAECARAGAMVAGGDVTSAGEIMIAVTAAGQLAGAAPVTRAGAQPGDVAAVSGPTGASAAGLALLTAGAGAGEAGLELAALIAAHRAPRPDYRQGPLAAAAGATAMIDVSDGLVADLGHIAQASGVAIDIDPGALPPAGLPAAAAALEQDWRGWALCGGEDHVLAATFSAAAAIPPGWTVVGAVAKGTGMSVGSRPWTGRGGWQHFGSR